MATILESPRRCGYDDRRRRSSELVDDEEIWVGPGSGSDVAEGFPWAWVVSYRGERRSGACATREEAEREAETVLRLLKRRPDAS